MIDGYSPAVAAKKWASLDDYIVDWQSGTFRNNAIPAGEFIITAKDADDFNAIVDEMERKHILKRTGSTKDKRNIIISITPEAQENLNEADSKIDMFLEEICSKVTPKQMQEIDRSLQLLCRLMENVDIKSTSTWDSVVNIRNNDVNGQSKSNITDQIN